MEFEYGDNILIEKQRKKIIRVLAILVIILAVIVLLAILYCMGILKLGSFAISGNVISSNPPLSLADAQNQILTNLANAVDVNLSNPPEGIEVSNVEPNNLSVQEINYGGAANQNKLFVVSFGN
ncbi:Uncharacterised protein [uncultured archaeon]|nr:Uncharacterised protein [uncultured archaeon]